MATSDPEAAPDMVLHDCIIIGSGLSALTAARTLTSAGLRPLLLEARDRTGGRAYTVSDGHGAPIDTGCAQIHGFLEGNPVRKLQSELGLPSAHIVKDAQTMVIGASASYDGDDTALLEAAASAFPVAYPPPAETESLSSLYFHKLSTDAKFAALTTEIGAGISLENISAKWWGYGRGFGGTDGSPIGGYSRTINALVEELQKKGAEIKLNEEVVEVKRAYLGRTASVEIRTRSGGIYSARSCISTIPLGVLQTSPPKFSPPLEPAFLAAVERTSVGVLEKVILTYSDVWWPESATYGTYLVFPAAASSATPTTLSELFSHSVISVSNLARTAPTSHPTLVIYLGAEAGRFISKYSPEEVASALHAYLAARLSPTTQPSAPKKFTVTRWLNDPFTRGATSSPVSLNTSPDGQRASPLDFVTLSRSTWNGALGWAGEHTDLDTRGSVVGAVVSGEREGRRVIDLLERTTK